MLPPRVAATLRTVIAESNRGGVTFYAADAAGLRTVSGATRGGASWRRRRGAEGQDCQRGRVLTKAMERNEDMLRSNPAAGSPRWPGDRRLPDQRHQRHLEVAARRGGGPRLVLPARVLALERAVGRPLPPHRGQAARRARSGAAGLLRGADGDADAAAGLRGAGARRARDGTAREGPRLPRDGGPGARPAGRERRARAGRAGRRRAHDRRRDKEKRYQQDFTVLVLVRDEAGRVVRKLSRRFANSGPLDKADEARRGRLLVLRETWLPPGRYTVEIAVQDASSGRLGVQRTPLEIGRRGEAGSVSSLVLVGHAAARGEVPPRRRPSSPRARRYTRARRGGLGSQPDARCPSSSWRERRGPGRAGAGWSSCARARRRSSARR